MRFDDLPEKHKRTALQMAVDAVKKLYAENNVTVEVNENSKEVLQLATDREYDIESGIYERGIKYERLVVL